MKEQLVVFQVSPNLLILEALKHLDMRSIDVACVVLLVRHQFDPVLFVWNHIAETVAFRVLGQSGCRKHAVDPLLENLLILGEDPLLLQLQLQGLTLGKPNRGTSVMEIQHTQRFLLQSPKEFLFIYIPAYQRDHSEQNSHFNKRPRHSALVITDCGIL